MPDSETSIFSLSGAIRITCEKGAHRLPATGLDSSRCCRWFATEACSGLRPTCPNVARYALRAHCASAARFDSSKHRAENTIPKPRRDTVVAVRKPVVLEVMLQQRSRENCGILMGAIV